MILTITASTPGEEQPAFEVEIAKVNADGGRAFVARRTDMPVGESCHVLVNVEDDDAIEVVIAKCLARIVGLKLAKPRTKKAEAAE